MCGENPILRAERPFVCGHSLECGVGSLLCCVVTERSYCSHPSAYRGTTLHIGGPIPMRVGVLDQGLLCAHSVLPTKLDFSHLRAKGIEIRCSPQCSRSADREVLLAPIPTMVRYGSWPLLAPLFSETPLPTAAGTLLGRLVFAGRCGKNRHVKSPEGFVERLTDAVCYAT